MRVVIITPPVVQLNTPYPSGAYLQNFFKRSECASAVSDVQWADLSIDLFHSIFSSQGLQAIFADTEEHALALADEAENAGDDGTAFNLRRYVSLSANWIRWIDTIKAMLGCDGRGAQVSSPSSLGRSPLSGREFVHEFVRSAHAPRGQRMDQFLQNLGREVCADDAQMLCTFALADLADYITAVFDENFALIRYAEHLAASNAPFRVLEEASRGPVMTRFYEPIVRSYLESLATPQALESLESGEAERGPADGEKILFCVSVPFAGTFTAALATCRCIRSVFGQQAIISMGGGYVNTALRSVHEPTLFNYTDYLSYDRGYGFYSELLKGCVPAATVTTDVPPSALTSVGGALLPDGSYFELPEAALQLEEQLTRIITPDYTGIDFSRYPRLADDVNPMHRIWSDGAWLKAYLAHGCYWHRCSFCDTTLDYVCNYKPVDTLALHKALVEQAEKTGVHGIHFVDEAAPPVALEKFALQNCRTVTRLTFWGNIRFEKAFTRDMADILAYGGLTGVSAGLEVASNDGLDNVNKGIDIQSVVSACAAFKEAGILVHSYMIYGFYDETPQQLVNSLETLRQLFKAGLIDSAFYHKFSLTEHSTIYKEWKDGKHPGLHPLPAASDAFSTYERSFKEESKSEKYGNGVQTALSNWMHGHGLEKNVTKWFDFPMPQPTVSKHLVDDEIARYEERNRKAYSAKQGDERYVWLGGKPVVLASGKNQFLLGWSYMGELLYADLPQDVRSKDAAKMLADLLWAYRPEASQVTKGDDATAAPQEKLPPALFRQLRGQGLCRV